MASAGFKIAEAFVEIVTKLDETGAKEDVRRAVAGAQSEMDKTTISPNVNWKAVDTLLDKMADVPMAIAKFAALGGVAAAIAKTAGAVISLSSSIGLASLSIAAIIPAAVGLGGTFGVLKLLFSDMESGVMKRLNDTFTALKERLRQVAVAAATPGLEVFLKGVNALTPLAENYVRRLATAVGVAASDFGKLAQNPFFRIKLDALLDDAATGMHHLAATVAPLIDVITTLGAAAGPTFTRFTFWIENLVKAWQRWVDMKYATGELQTLLRQSADEASKLGKIIWNFFSGIVGLLRGAKGPALEFSDSVLKISESFKAWAWKPETQEKVAKFVDFLTHIDVNQFFKVALAFGAVGKTLDAFSGLAGVIEGFGKLIAIGPIGLVFVVVAAAVAVLTGGLVAAYMVSQKFRDVVAKVFFWVKDNVVPILEDFYHWLADKIVPAVDKAATNTIPGFRSALEQMAKAWTDNKVNVMEFLDRLKPVIEWLIDPGIPTIGLFAGAMIKVLGFAIGVTIRGLALLDAAINGAIAGFNWTVEAITTAGHAMVSIWTWVTETASMAWRGMSVVIGEVTAAIVAGWTWLMTALQPVFAVLNFMIGGWVGFIQWAWGVVQPVLTFMGIAFETLRFTVLSALGIAGAAIDVFAATMMALWNQVVSPVITFINAAWLMLSGVVQQVVGYVINGIAMLIGAFQNMRNSAQETTSFVSYLWQAMWLTVTGIADQIADTCLRMWWGLREGVSSAVGFAIDSIQSLMNVASNVARRVNEALSSIGNSITSKLNPFGWAHGGIAGAATGGVRGGMHMVGEHGPELLQLPPGSRVRSNPDTRRMMQEGSGQQAGSTGVDVSFSGNTSDALATAIMLLVRQGKIQFSARA